MNYTFGDYEQALLRSLAPMLAANGGVLQELAGYSGQFEEDEAFQFWLAQFPAAAVAITAAAYPEEGRTTQFWRQDITALIYLGANGWRDENGVYQLMDQARRLLLGKDAGLEIRPIDIVGEEIIYEEFEAVVAIQEYRLINDRISEVMA